MDCFAMLLTWEQGRFFFKLAFEARRGNMHFRREMGLFIMNIFTYQVGESKD